MICYRKPVPKRRPCAGPVSDNISKGGLPHSEIVGSKPIRSSPTLIAAYHVLHSLLSPRHPLNALVILN